MRIIFLTKTIISFCTKDFFHALFKDHPLVYTYFDNYMTHCQGGNDFCLLHLFIVLVFYLKVLNLDYSKNVPSSCINYCSNNDDVKWHGRKMLSRDQI